jgi:hypothetical protein
MVLRLGATAKPLEEGDGQFEKAGWGGTANQVRAEWLDRELYLEMH